MRPAAGRSVGEPLAPDAPHCAGAHRAAACDQGAQAAMRPDHNNIGVIRLVLACLVIIGHAPELIDGNRSREPLIALFHTMSLGELSVDGFFILSGYLITASMLRTKSLRAFLWRRVLRIFPAFIAASLISVFVLGPVVGARPWTELVGTGIKIATLQPPIAYPGQLAGMPYPALNGAMWSIGLEFRCYLLVAAFGCCGLLKRRRAMAALTLCLMLCAMALTVPSLGRSLDRLTEHRWVYLPLGGTIPSTIRLDAIFMVGACAYLFKADILPLLQTRRAALCAAIAILSLYRNPHLSEAALTIFGGAALFWLAFKADIGRLRRINDGWDISYGVYLYGWPIATAILWFDRAISPWALASLTLLIALAFGAASWWGIEKRMRDLARPRRTEGSSRTIVSATPARSVT